MQAPSPIRIVVTGNAAELRPRLPAQAGGRPLDWDIVPVLAFENVAVDETTWERMERTPPAWLLFTSAAAVSRWTDAMVERGYELPDSTKVACIGKRTAAIADREGFTADFIPDESSSEAFLPEFRPLLAGNEVILLPSAQGGRLMIRETLREWGHEVIAPVLYRAVKNPALDPETHRRSVDDADWIVLTSPSSARAFAETFAFPPTARIACLGAYTREHLEAQGIAARAIPGADYARLAEVLC